MTLKAGNAKGEKVGVCISGELTIHIPHNTGNYYTLCGLAGDDPSSHQQITEVPKTSKINCKQCKSIFKLCQQYTNREFV